MRENLAKPVQVKIDGKIRQVSTGEAILIRALRDAVSGGKRAAEQRLKLMERFDLPEEKETESVWDLEKLSMKELVELEQLACKATDRMDEFYALEEQGKRNDEAARNERIRIFRPNILSESSHDGD